MNKIVENFVRRLKYFVPLTGMQTKKSKGRQFWDFLGVKFRNLQDSILCFVAIYVVQICGMISRSCGSQEFLKKSRWPSGSDKYKHAG